MKIMTNRAEKKLNWIFRLSSTGRLVLSVSLRQSLKRVKFWEHYKPWKNPRNFRKVPDKPNVLSKLTSFFRVQNKKKKLLTKNSQLLYFIIFYSKNWKNPPSHICYFSRAKKQRNKNEKRNKSECEKMGQTVYTVYLRGCFRRTLKHFFIEKFGSSFFG